MDFMDNEEEQDKYFAALIRSALAGKVLTDNEKWVRFIEKALSSIEETRDKYYEKSKKNGMKGKEYGIQGKEYGIQGKEYGKLGGRPRKRPDVYEKIYSFILSDENYLKSALSEDKAQNRMLYRNIKARIPEVTENNDENNKLINGVIKKIKEENTNNNNGDNKVQ